MLRREILRGPTSTGHETAARRLPFLDPMALRSRRWGMPEFDDLFDDLVPQGTVRFTLSKVFVRSDKPLVLVMKHAGEGNAAYKSARTRVAKELAAHSGSGDAEATRAVNVKLFATTVIEGWENCMGRNGEPLKYTPELGTEFLLAISKKAPDELNAAFLFAWNPDNFRGSPAATAAALGK